MTQATLAKKPPAIPPEEAQRSLWEMDFAELKAILEQSGHNPISQDKVDWLIEKAKIGYDEDQRHGRAVMPHFYVIRQIVDLSDQVLQSFLTRLRDRVAQKVQQAAISDPEN
jgi:hypothetical protein